MMDSDGNSNKFDGETGSDTVAYAGVGTAGVTVNLSDSSMNTGEAAGDTYRSIEHVMGSAFDDILIGTKKSNLLYGGDGNDTLVGAGGADRLNGREGLDYASYHGSSAGVTVDLVLTGRNTGDAEGDRYSDIEGIIGSAHGDNLTGDTDDNIIDGGAGSDIIDGVSGTDVLWGDGQSFGVDGADIFLFRGPDFGFKTIMDFDVQDHVQISRTGFGLSSLFELTEGSTLIIAHANPTATTGHPTFLVEQSTGNLYFDADGGGAGIATLIANVQFHSQEYLDLSDFVLV